jgi:hypothetical protein
VAKSDILMPVIRWLNFSEKSASVSIHTLTSQLAMKSKMTQRAYFAKRDDHDTDDRHPV